MKTFSLLAILSAMFLIQTANASDGHKAGQQLYKDNCASCHGTSGGMDMNKRVAPPIIAVRMHYISTYTDKDSFVMAVADWVEKQDADNSLMRGAIRRFNIMPPLSISRTDAEKIAEYIYEGNVEKPEGFQQHFEERHGKNRNH